MSEGEIIFWTIIAATIAAEVLGGIICWVSCREVDQCHK